MDAGHSRTSEETSESFEMDRLDDNATTPDPRRHQHQRSANPDFEEDSADEDEALLVPRERPPMEEIGNVPVGRASVWVQARRIVIETGPTLLLTTVGLLFTGELLNNVSHWKAMSRVDELIMIIPVVLNLKGNLEMNLSARLSTAANIGELDRPKARRQIIRGNLTLLQVQATLVSFVAALVAFGLGRLIPSHIPEDPQTEVTGLFTRHIASNRSLHQARLPRPSPLPKSDPGGLAEFLVTASSAMLAACMSSVLLGSFMCMLVVLCRKFGLDPDNIAPPVAACLGDLVTLLLLGVVSAINIALIKTPIPLVIIILLAIAAVGWAVVTRGNRRVSHLLHEGWLPLFAAMVISCGTGIVLDLFVSRFEGFALLAAVISGLPGNVGSIFVSRLSTALHTASYSLAGLPATSADDLSAPKTLPSEPPPSSRLVMITLCCVTFPIEIAFLATLRALGWLRVPFIFLASSLLFFVIAVIASLFLAQLLTHFLWKRNLDPDMYALPIHSALVDLIGQLLLVVCFEILSHLGVPLKSQDG
ncbi:hypothetical protein BC835DRAFT_1405045 [Cytidiella melzeri]|nr:hypothetical protein BC835DRAFT_1405045 [Cytidiella melzeri]